MILMTAISINCVAAYWLLLIVVAGVRFGGWYGCGEGCVVGGSVIAGAW